MTHETPPAPTSEVLDDYSAICSRPGMDAITSIMRDTLGDQYRVFRDACVSDPQQAGEWLGSMVADMMGMYDEYHMSVAGR